MAAITLVRLLSTVNPLVSVQVVTLNEPHIARITGKWLFPCEQSQVKSFISIYQNSLHISLDAFIICLLKNKSESWPKEQHHYVTDINFY